ncbi:MAG: thrombospondin type 3 repeat-containing protein, partial [Candidatus Binatia bacterium]
TARCPGGSLNGDADLMDLVPQLWLGTAPGAPPQSLGRAATALGLSDSLLAALVSEPGDGVDYNRDGDAADQVVQVRDLSAGAWTNVAQAGDSLVVAGRLAVFTTPEAAQGADLNLDGDRDDRVVQIYDAAAGTLRGLGQAAAEIVVGEPADTACGPVQLVAFRTPEPAQGGQNLNAASGGQPTGDDDADDAVLQVYDAVSRTLRNTGQAAVRCDLEACDPRLPYRIEGGRVKFLTFEPDQAYGDLNNDGNQEGIVLQLFDFCSGRATVISSVAQQPGHDPLDDGDASGALLAEGGRCDLGRACDPLADTCDPGAFCAADSCDTGAGSCRRHAALDCTADADCHRCRLAQPATCLRDADCPAGATCEPDLIAVGRAATDTDADGVPDEQDNCPLTPNTNQADADGDDVGTACDARLQALGAANLLLKDDPADAGKRKLVLLVKDASLLAPVAGALTSPPLAGARLRLTNAASGEALDVTLPAAGWKGLGQPAGSKGYTYRDPQRAAGPCRSALLKPGKLKAVCGGAALAFTLDEPSQGALAVAVTSGIGAEAAAYCSQFSGSAVRVDRGAPSGRPPLFKARNAPPPAGCAPL